MITSKEKAELLKSTIEQLYSNEGRTISYISRLLEINRKTVSEKIKEWALRDPKPMRHLNPSSRKFLNKHRNLIKSRLDKNVTMTSIAEELKISRHSLYKTFIQNDDVLKKAYDDYINRLYANASERRKKCQSVSSREYDIAPIQGEVWRRVFGYDNYEVSNKGRVRRYVPSYESYMLIKSHANIHNGRLYIKIGEKNISVARLVAHTFVDGFSAETNTVNHKDGDVMNNSSDNLEWVSQSDNNAHAYHTLNRRRVFGKRYNFDRILYKDKYSFKTVAAFARFIGKSETQTRRYMDEPDKYDIQLINNCND